MENTAKQQAEAFWNTLEIRIKAAIVDPWLFRKLISDGVAVLKPMLLSDFEGTKKVIGLLSDFCHVIFKTVDYPFKPFEAQIMGKEFEIGIPSQWIWPSHELYLTATMLAIVARDRRNVAYLPDVQRRNQTQTDNVVFKAMADFYGKLYTTDPDIWTLYEDAMLATNPAQNPRLPIDLLDLLLAQLSLFKGALDKNATLLEQELPKVIRLTEAFWETQAAPWERELRPDVLPIMAVSVYAHGSLGIDFSYESVYLPQWLMG